jgi:hypothetical protein
MESKGLKINAGKMETMVCSKIDELEVIQDCQGNILKQVGTFKYLGLVINAMGGCEEDARHRIKAAWHKWNYLSSMVHDRKMSTKVNGKDY